MNPGSKREIFGWSMYDVANSAYTTVVISFVYSAFFVDYIVPGASQAQGTYWSIAILGSTVLSMVLSPYIGRLIDRGFSKKKLLFTSTAICSLFTALLALVSPGQIWLGIAIIFVSNATWMLGESINASFLSDLASKKNMGLVSGIAWGVGYLGGLLSMVIVVLLWVSAAAGTPEYVAQNQSAMIVMAVFFMVFSLPTFLLVKDRRTPNPNPGMTLFTMVQDHKLLTQFFIAFTFYMAGMQAIIKFIGIYTSSVLGMSQQDLISVFLATQLSAFFGALAFGFIERALGAKRTILLSIGLWLVCVLSMYFLENLAALFGMAPNTMFIFVALMAGSGMGSIQSASRGVVGLVAPESEAGSSFGLWGFFVRAASILAVGFGVAFDIVGGRQALWVVIALFAIGGFLLWRLKSQALENHKAA
ncbi:MFS transporter [Salinibius halmophilus]|uniref:MFS transporter n=1 Tax=Salinibius halmophilus TaxID=1853216 RepID=UPI0013149DE3|nr:MFS transporter [Salinibius halmophilus]